MCAQVHILGRMGNAAQALRLIVERLADIPQAIAFVQGQDDEDLWQLLISLALGSAATAGVRFDASCHGVTACSSRALPHSPSPMCCSLICRVQPICEPGYRMGLCVGPCENAFLCLLQLHPEFRSAYS